MNNHDKIFCHKKFEGYTFIFPNAEGVHASLPECWKGTWSEKGWESMLSCDQLRPEMATDQEEGRSRLRQASAFYCRTRIQTRGQKFLKNRNRIHSHFLFAAVGVSLVWYFLSKTLLNFGCIDGVRSLKTSRIFKFENFRPGSGFKNFGTGAESDFEHVTPTTSG